MPADAPRPVAGLSELAPEYAAFLLDIWGVLHDGERLYPGVPGALAALRAGGWPVVLISNVPKPAALVTEQLAAMGIEAGQYDALVTSGQSVLESLEAPGDGFHAGLGRRVLVLPGAAAPAFTERLSWLVAVDRPEAADFVLALGPVPGWRDVVAHETLLARCRAVGLPMICANPDLNVMRGTRLEICAGALAARYEQMGGEVAWHGKPHGPIYRTCLAHLPGLAPERILAVGDSPRTDMAGAAAAGLDGLLVAGGLHGRELIDRESGGPDARAAAVRLAEAGTRARYVMAGLRW